MRLSSTTSRKPSFVQQMPSGAFLAIDGANSLTSLAVRRAGAVGDGPHRGLAGADEGHVGVRRDGEVTRVGNDGIERDLEARRQLDLLQVALDGFGVGAGLRDRRDGLADASGLHLLELLERLRLGLRLRLQRQQRGTDQACKRGEREALNSLGHEWGLRGCGRVVLIRPDGIAPDDAQRSGIDRRSSAGTMPPGRLPTRVAPARGVAPTGVSRRPSAARCRTCAATGCPRPARPASSSSADCAARARDAASAR